MTQVTHTKGPWEVTPRRAQVYANGHVIAVVYEASAESGTTPEAIANARLIAAAPELLEALERGFAYLRDYCIASGGPDPQDRNVLDAMSAAIAHAKGGAA